jgi:hypothetical protein
MGGVTLSVASTPSNVLERTGEHRGSCLAAAPLSGPAAQLDR